MGEPLGRWRAVLSSSEKSDFSKLLLGEFEADQSFVELQGRYPVQARLLLAFFRHIGSALDTLATTGDLKAAQVSVSAAEEIYSWLKNCRAPRLSIEISQLWSTLIKAGVPGEQAALVLQNSVDKPRGAPVSNRLPVLLAFEKRTQDGTSWGRLAREFCPCDKPKHDIHCKERIRQQAMKLEEMMMRLGV